MAASSTAQRQNRSKYQPWYKERLELKYMRTNPKAAALNGKKWMFVRSDIDDLRSGVPVPMTDKDMVIKGRDDIIPVIDSTLDLVGVSSSRRKAGLGRHPVKEALKQCGRGRQSTTLYTKVGPRRQIQTAHLDKLMQELSSHPLALHPHLEEAIPPELFDDMVDLLDPELKPTSSEAEVFGQAQSPSLCALVEEEEGGGGPTTYAAQLEEGNRSLECKQEEPLDEEDMRDRELVYRQPLRKSDKEEAEAVEEEMTKRKVVSPSQMSRVKNVTQDLCQWMRKLKTEDDQNCLDEGTIQNLFTSNPDKMVDNMVPFQVIEVVNIPDTLWGRFQSREDSAALYREAHQQSVPVLSQEHATAAPAPSKLVRTKYGAWYLTPRSWKLRKKDEPLRDPKEVAKETESLTQQDSTSLDESLINAHGSKAFKQFVATERPSSNMPYFLKDVVLPSKPTGAPSSSHPPQVQHHN